MKPIVEVRRVSELDWSMWVPRIRATLLFVIRDGHLLLIEKKRGFGAGKVNGPGGKLAPGETAMQAALREVEEEVGVVPRNVRARGTLSFQFVGTPPGWRPTDPGTPPGWRPTDSGTPPGWRPTDPGTPPGPGTPPADGWGMHVSVFTADDCDGEVTESEEARPFWCAAEALPYERMWADDRVWLPALLAGHDVTLRAVFDGDEMLDHTLVTDAVPSPDRSGPERPR